MHRWLAGWFVSVASSASCGDHVVDSCGYCCYLLDVNSAISCDWLLIRPVVAINWLVGVDVAVLYA